MRWFRRKGARAPKSMRRDFITPEGCNLGLDLAGAGNRATAFLIDVAIMVALLIAATIAIVYLLAAGMHATALPILWLLGFFVLRNFWFILFEMGGRGATPGKRVMKLRVIARDGARLTGGAVVARNMLREIEIFLPLSFLFAQAGNDAADSAVVLFGLVWSGVFLFFPLFNRDRLRVGDLVAGTWVVQDQRGSLGIDLATLTGARPPHVFSAATLDLYGIRELQTLEEVLRGGRDDAITMVAATIRHKAGIADDFDDTGFLSDYYAALCARLERNMLVGRRRESKTS